MREIFFMCFVSVCLCYEDPKIVVNSIKSCKATFEQDNFPCVKAIDGNFDNNNGWGVLGSGFPQKPQNITFNFAGASDVDFMRITCNFDGSTHQIRLFSILVDI